MAAKNYSVKKSMYFAFIKLSLTPQNWDFEAGDRKGVDEGEPQRSAEIAPHTRFVWRQRRRRSLFKMMRCCRAGVLLLSALARADDDPLVQSLKFDLWQRGETFPCGREGCADEESASNLGSKWMMARHKQIQALRGGADGCSAATSSCEPVAAANLDAFRAELGPEFSAALDKNELDHEADCAKSCESFYCGDASTESPAAPAVPHASHPMGSVPPEDFVSEFNFPLDLIKVTSEPMIPPDECERVVKNALEEEMANNEYTSGKYKLGGDCADVRLESSTLWDAYNAYTAVLYFMLYFDVPTCCCTTACSLPARYLLATCSLPAPYLLRCLPIGHIHRFFANHGVDGSRTATVQG